MTAVLMASPGGTSRVNICCNEYVDWMAMIVSFFVSPSHLHLPRSEISDQYLTNIHLFLISWLSIWVESMATLLLLGIILFGVKYIRYAPCLTYALYWLLRLFLPLKLGLGTSCYVVSLLSQAVWGCGPQAHVTTTSRLVWQTLQALIQILFNSTTE